MHSTNYINTFIEVAEDSKAKTGEVPPYKGKTKTIANLEYEMLHDSPYVFTSDEVIFNVYATRKNITAKDLKAQADIFFSKGQPCFRASALGKRYGWGIHNDEIGRIAIYGINTKAYKQYLNDSSIIKTKAMRSKKV